MVKSYTLSKTKHAAGLRRPRVAHRTVPNRSRRDSGGSSFSISTWGVSAIVVIVSLAVAWWLGSATLTQLFFPWLFPLDQTQVIAFTTLPSQPNTQTWTVSLKPDNHKVVAIKTNLDQLAASSLAPAKVATVSAPYVQQPTEPSEQKVLRAYYSSKLGMVVDGVVLLNGTDESIEAREVEPKDLKDHLEASLWSQLEISDLRDPRQWWQAYRKQPQALATWVFVRKVSPKHWQVSQVSSDKWAKSRIQLLPADRDTNCPVAVINNTEESALANRAAEIYEQSQLQVVRVISGTPQPQTQIMVNPEATECEAIIRQVTAPLAIEAPVVTDSNLPQQYRADVVVSLGSDVLGNLFF